MKYHIIKKGGLILIDVSGKNKKNEAILANRMFSSYLKEEGIRVIINLKKLEKADPITILGI